jgi:hypothetical protein
MPHNMIGDEMRTFRTSHVEFDVTATDSVGDNIIGTVLTYTEALQLVIDYANQEGGNLEAGGSDAWNLWQSDSAVRINILCMEVRSEVKA